MHFRDRIRDQRKFKSAQELVQQIEKDVQYAREAKLTLRKEPACAERKPAAAGGSTT